MSVAPKAAEPAGTSSPDVLARNLGWLLSQASHALTTEMTAALEGIGLLPRGHCVLATALTGERTQTELAQLVGLDKTTMVVTLDELERRGLAERRPSPSDRRVRVVAVTDAGRRKVAEADEVVARVQQEVLAALAEDRREALLEGLADLLGGSLAAPATCSRPVRRRR
jgi:MarR family transcriptional regulator for hemolysin